MVLPSALSFVVKKAQILFLNFINISPIVFDTLHCKILFALTCGILADPVSICIDHSCRVLGIMFTALKIVYSKLLLPAVATVGGL